MSGAPAAREVGAAQPAIPGLAYAFAWGIAGQVAGALVGLASAALVNRALGAAGRGVVAEIQTWGAMFASLFGLSLSLSIYHFANRQRYPMPDSARLALVLASSCATALLSAAALAVYTVHAPQRFSVDAAAQRALLVVSPVATIFATNMLALGQGLGRVRLVGIVTIVQAVAGLAAVAGAYLAGSLDVRFAVAAAIAVQLAGSAWIAGTVWRSAGGVGRGLVPGSTWRFVSAGLKIHVATVCTFGYTTANQLLVFHYAGSEQTGLLAVALTLSFGLFGAFGALQVALYPRVIHGTDDLDVTIRMLRLGLYSGLVAAVALVVAARPLLHAYGGERFLEAAPAFRLLVLAAWTVSLSSLAAPYVVKAGAFGLASASALVLGICSVALNLLLVPRHGTIGAAAATLGTTLLGFALSLGMLRLLSGRWPWAALLPDFGAERAAAEALLRRLWEGRRAPQASGRIK